MAKTSFVTLSVNGFKREFEITHARNAQQWRLGIGR